MSRWQEVSQSIICFAIIASVFACLPASADPSDSAIDQGIRLIKQNEYSQAIPYLDQAIKLNPKNDAGIFVDNGAYHSYCLFRLHAHSTRTIIQIRE